MIPFGLEALMTVSLPIGRRTTKCLVPGASAIYLMNEGGGQILRDHSGNGYHGTLGSTAGADTNDPTWGPAGLTFGAGDNVAIPAFQASSGDRTQLSVVAAITSPAMTVMKNIISQYNGITDRRSWALLTHDTNRMVAVISDDGTPTGHVMEYRSANSTVAPNTPVTIGFVFNAGALDLYINGAPTTPTKTADNAIATIYTNAVDPVYVGLNPPYFDVTDGLQVHAIYTCPFALSAAQVTQTHAALKGILAPRGVVLP